MHYGNYEVQVILLGLPVAGWQNKMIFFWIWILFYKMHILALHNVIVQNLQAGSSVRHTLPGHILFLSHKQHEIGK